MHYINRYIIIYGSKKLGEEIRKKHVHKGYNETQVGKHRCGNTGMLGIDYRHREGLW